MDVEAARLIGGGLAAIGMIGAGAGVGLCGLGAVQAIARNPEARGSIMTFFIMSIAFAEAVAIYALLVAIIILFVI